MRGPPVYWMVVLPAVTIALLTSGRAVAAQGVAADEPAGLVVAGTRVNQAPVIDGRLDEGLWRRTTPVSGFVQREPVEGRPASERTEVRFVFDREAMYIGASMFDRDPRGLVLGETRRDATLDETDAFLVILDTFLDRQNGFVFATTPAGIEYDGQVTKEGQGGIASSFQRQQVGSGGGFNLNWDGSWQVATSVDSSGWYAEFRIPFSTLRYGQGGRQLWGVNLSRRIRRRNEEVFWAPIPRQYNLYRVSLAGVLQGIEAPSRRSVQITPYALSSAHRDFAAGRDTDMNADLGGDAKIGVTPSLTLDLTYNTDFAQVEVDDQQINLTRFPLFFPEKRPFFLENAGLFAVGTAHQSTDPGIDLFFSRRIGIASGGEVPILGGGRLTGRAGGLNVGLLNIQMEGVETAGVSANNYAAGRVMRELPNRSRVGALVVSRLNTDSTGDYNMTYAVDGRLGLGEAIDLDGYAAVTQTPGLDGREHAVSLMASYTTRDWDNALAAREVGEDFNPEVGFLARSGYRYLTARVLRNIRTPGVSWIRQMSPHSTYRSYWDFGGFNQSRFIHFDWVLEFANGARSSTALNLIREGLEQPFEIADGILIPTDTYDTREFKWRFNSNESAPLSVNSELTVGGFYSGHRKGWSTTFTARAGGTLATAVRLGYDDVDLAEGDFKATLASLRVSYAFTPRIYLQSLLQYNNQTDNFSSNVRFGWLGTAGTGLFVVINDIEQTGTDWEPMDRAVVVKFTRQFNLVQ